MYMTPEMRKWLGLFLWEVFEVVEIHIYTTGRKYPRETKWIYCIRKDGNPIRFLWYEVELINPQK